MKDFMDRLKGWRTAIVAFLVMLVSLLTMLQDDATMKAFMAAHPKLASQIGVTLGIVMIVLRVLTTGPLGGDEKTESGDGTTK